MPSQTAAPPQQGQMMPGSRFSIPPFTDEVEQPDNNDLIVATASNASQVPVNGIVPFMQSDVIYGWIMEVVPSVTFSVAPTLSPYDPYIHLGPLLLNMQYQYPSISVASGIDLAMVNAYRPIVEAKRGMGNFTQNLATGASAGMGSFGGPQASQLFTQYTTATTAQTANFIMELPASCWFDSYYELDETGMPVSGPHQGFVSPQNMGGYARVVTPSLRLNQYITTSQSFLDQSVGFSATSVASAATTLLGFSRIAVLGSLDSSVLPQPTNWQYNIAHQQVSLAGLSKVTIPLNGIFAGQIMSICLRMWDPTTGGGQVLPVTNVTNFLVQYGGSVQRFNGGVTSSGTVTSVKRLQRRFLEQHFFMPPDGFLIYDMAFDRNLGITNSYCLNTLRTAAVQVQVIFSAAQAAGAYMEATIEGLRWVPLPVNPSQ